MCSGRLPFAILLCVLLLAGQWPLSVIADRSQDDHPTHCDAQAEDGPPRSADRADDAGHQSQCPDHGSPDCHCNPACGGCFPALAAITSERFQPHADDAARPDPPLADGLVSRPISPVERPPRSLLD